MRLNNKIIFKYITELLNCWSKSNPLDWSHMALAIHPYNELKW